MRIPSISVLVSIPTLSGIGLREGTATWFFSDLGPFQFNAFAVQDESIAAHKCDTPGSSTGVVGSAEMIFDDESEVWLKLRSNEACFNTSFSGIDLVEEYVITNGTGRFEAAKGKVRLELTGSFPGPPPFPFDATMEGKIKLRN